MSGRWLLFVLLAGALWGHSGALNRPPGVTRENLSCAQVRLGLTSRQLVAAMGRKPDYDRNKLWLYETRQILGIVSGEFGEGRVIIVSGQRLETQGRELAHAGMSQAQLRVALGEPTRVRTQGGDLIWEFQDLGLTILWSERLNDYAQFMLD